MATLSEAKLKARQLLERAEQALNDALASKDSLRSRHEREISEMRLRHQAEASDIQQMIVAGEVRLDALRQAFGVLEELDEEPAFVPRQAGRRGRVMSSKWRGWLGHLPIRPAEGMLTGDFIDIVQRDRPDMPRNNVRSQLNNMKVKGLVELVDGRWRLTRAIQDGGDESPAENEASTEPSEAEAPYGDAEGASDTDPPQSSFQAQAAA